MTAHNVSLNGASARGKALPFSNGAGATQGGAIQAGACSTATSSTAPPEESGSEEDEAGPPLTKADVFKVLFSRASPGVFSEEDKEEMLASHCRRVNTAVDAAGEQQFDLPEDILDQNDPAQQYILTTPHPEGVTDSRIHSSTKSENAEIEAAFLGLSASRFATSGACDPPVGQLEPISVSKASLPLQVPIANLEVPVKAEREPGGKWRFASAPNMPRHGHARWSNDSTEHILYGN